MGEYKLAINMAKDLLQNYLDDKYIYHNYEHTLNVVEAAYIIGSHNKLSQHDLDLLIISAWFHDTGYCTSALNHEEYSVKIAQKILSTLDFEQRELQIIEDAILSTTMPQSPKTGIEECLCDADLYHLSQPNYFDVSDLLRKEMLNIGNIDYSEEEWQQCNREFMTKHKYHTQYGRTELEKGKMNNLKNIAALKV